MSPVYRPNGSSDSLYRIEPPNPGDAFLEIAEGSSPELKKARDPLIYYLTGIHSKLNSDPSALPSDKAISALSLLLIDNLVNLGAQDYRILAASLMRLRKDPNRANFRVLTGEDNGFSPNICSVTDCLREIDFHMLGDNAKLALETIANDTVELMRLVCRQAVNMVDPNWETARPCFGADEKIKISQGHFSGGKLLESFSIIVKPIIQTDPLAPDPFLSGIYYRERGKPDVFLKSIADGESVVVGRHLRKKSVFGLSIDDKVMSEIKATAYVDHECASRAGIKIFKLNEIYIFNKLSRNNYVITSENKKDPSLSQSISFYGNTFWDGSNWSIGRSEIH